MDEAVIDLRKVVNPLYIVSLVAEDAIKALEESGDCVARITSCCPLIDRLDQDMTCACVPLTQKGTTNIG